MIELEIKTMKAKDVGKGVTFQALCNSLMFVNAQRHNNCDYFQPIYFIDVRKIICFNSLCTFKLMIFGHNEVKDNIKFITSRIAQFHAEYIKQHFQSDLGEEMYVEFIIQVFSVRQICLHYLIIYYTIFANVH